MRELKETPSEELFEELQRRIGDQISHQQQIDDLNTTISEINQKLTEAESLKTHFISNISNELVNPFTSILAITENILRVEKENWKKVFQMVSLIHTEVFNLDFQLKNIFRAAKLEAGELSHEISLININELFADLVNSFRYEVCRKNVIIKLSFKSLSSETPIFFKSDAKKIHLTISNLLSNAIKFSYEEGEVLLNIKKEGNSLSISVQDYGEGISKINEQIIFDRFKRLDTGINSLNRGSTF